MTKCKICSVINNKKFKAVYEDELVYAILHPQPSVPGHILLFPKEHTPIIELLDNETMGRIGVVANEISKTIFDELACQGSNIIINNGVSAGQKIPHITFDIIPRKTGDGINLEWQGQQANEKDLDEIVAKLTAAIKDDAKKGGKETQSIVHESSKGSVIKEEEGKENYYLKQLSRKP